MSSRIHLIHTKKRSIVNSSLVSYSQTEGGPEPQPGPRRIAPPSLPVQRRRLTRQTPSLPRRRPRFIGSVGCLSPNRTEPCGLTGQRSGSLTAAADVFQLSADPTADHERRVVVDRGGLMLLVLGVAAGLRPAQAELSPAPLRFLLVITRTQQRWRVCCRSGPGA